MIKIIIITGQKKGHNTQEKSILGVQSQNCVRHFATPCTAARQASLSSTISRGLLKLISTESEMPPNHLILCRPILLLPSIFPSIRVFSKESVHPTRWPKYWSFSINISPSNEFSELISLELTGLISSQSKGLSRVFSNTTVQKHHSLVFSLLYGYTLTHIHNYWKNHSFAIWTFNGKIMSLLFNMLSRLVIAFLSRNKRLFISWLQSPSAVILEPKT